MITWKSENRQSPPDKNNSYWLTLEPYVHIKAYENSVMLYNTLNGELFETDDPKFISLFKRMQKIENLQVVDYPNNLDIEAGLKINRLIESHFIDMIEKRTGNLKPVQIPPVYKIMHDNSEARLENVKKGILELTVYLTGYCEKDCEFCREYYRQFAFCKKSDKGVLDASKIMPVLEDLTSGINKVKLNLAGGNPTAFPKFWDLLAYSESKQNVQCRVLYNYLHESGINELLSRTDNKTKLHVLVNQPINKNKFRTMAKLISERQVQAEYSFEIQDDQHYEIVEEEIRQSGIKDFRVKPFFNGSNIDYFSENVFIRKEDLLNGKKTQRQININDRVNLNYYGKLIIDCDGMVFSNINKKAIGNIYYERIIDVLKSEINSGETWFSARSNIFPCAKCIYNNLCPPLSNYESVFNKNNLCLINESSWKRYQVESESI